MNKLPSIRIAGTVILFALLEFFALQMRISFLSRNLNQAEYLHFLPTITGRHIVDFLIKISPNLQPITDYALLRFLWIPLFGIKELPLRMHSVLASLSTVGLVFGFALTYFRRISIKGILPWLFALTLGLWAIVHPTERYLSVEIRHYSLLATVSVLWWANYLLFETKILSKRFLLLSLLFVNTHFFALALVAAAFGYEILLQIKKNGAFQNKELRWLIIAPLSILVFTGFANFPAFRWLVVMPPAQNTNSSFATIFADAFYHWLGFFRYVAWPLGTLVMLGVLTAFIFISKNLQPVLARFLFFFFFGIPIFYFFTRARSSLPFGERYHTVFYGFGFVALVFFWEALYKILSRFIQKQATAVLIGLACITCIPSMLAIGGAERISVREYANIFRTLNFSENYREQEYAQSFKQPIFWLHDACWESDNPLYYLAHNSSIVSDPQEYSKAYPYGYLVVDSVGCEHKPEFYAPEIQRFYANHAQSILVLRAKDMPRKDCESRSFAKLPANIKIELLPANITSHCIWIAHGVKEAKTAQALANLVGLNYEPAFFHPNSTKK